MLTNSSVGVNGEADVGRSPMLGVLRLQQVTVEELFSLIGSLEPDVTVACLFRVLSIANVRLSHLDRSCDQGTKFVDNV